MMYSTKILLAGAVALSAVTGVAQAADLPPLAPPPPPPPVIEQPVEYGSGWYLRGDVGYANYNTPDLYQGAPFIDLVNEDWEAGWVVGIGAGYQFNSWFRADLTAEYRATSTITANSICGICAGGFTNNSVDLSSWVFMANGYIDLGTWHSITPYIGAGVGWARHSADLFRNHGPAWPGGVTSISGSTDWDFAWAAMAGASFDVTSNMKIDAGYRYINLGSAVSGVYTNLGTVAPAIVYDDLTAHEFRLGVRYMFDSAPAVQDYTPITTKY